MTPKVSPSFHLGGALRLIAGDLRPVEGARDAVHEALHALGASAEIVVSAAGVYALAPAAKIDAEDWSFNPGHQPSRSVLRGPGCGRGTVKRSRRRELTMAVVNISSVGYLSLGNGGDAALSYSASKAGLVALTKSMAAEWAAQGVPRQSW